jgi:hypothetical protein
MFLGGALHTLPFSLARSLTLTGLSQQVLAAKRVVGRAAGAYKTNSHAGSIVVARRHRHTIKRAYNTHSLARILHTNTLLIKDEPIKIIQLGVHLLLVWAHNNSAKTKHNAHVLEYYGSLCPFFIVRLEAANESVKRCSRSRSRCISRKQ